MGVVNTTTLSEDATTYEEARDVFRELAQSVGSRLKKAGKKAGMVSMEVRYYDFRNMSHQVQLQKPTNDPVILCETACNLFRESWSGEPVRLLGIRTSKLVEESAPEQLTIFDIEFPKEPDEKHKKLNAALEQLNDWGVQFFTAIKSAGKDKCTMFFHDHRSTSAWKTGITS